MRITKVYTRTGDAGKTRLAGGQQVWKDSLRVEAYGTVDELNASIGVVRAMNADMLDEYSAAAILEEELRWVQNKLFDVGSILATAPGQTFKNMPTGDGERCDEAGEADRSLPERSGAAQGIYSAGRRARSPAFCIKPGRSAGALNGSVWPLSKVEPVDPSDHQVCEPAERHVVCAWRAGSPRRRVSRNSCGSGMSPRKRSSSIRSKSASRIIFVLGGVASGKSRGRAAACRIEGTESLCRDRARS